MTHMDVIDGYLASNRIKYCRFDDLIGLRHGTTTEIVIGLLVLKPKVALRIEQATGLDAADLLCRQAQWQIQQLRERNNARSDDKTRAPRMVQDTSPGICGPRRRKPGIQQHGE